MVWKEEAAYPTAAERIISGSKDYKSCSQDMVEKLAASRMAAEATLVKTHEDVYLNGGDNDDLVSAPSSKKEGEKKDEAPEEVVDRSFII